MLSGATFLQLATRGDKARRKPSQLQDRITTIVASRKRSCCLCKIVKPLMAKTHTHSHPHTHTGIVKQVTLTYTLAQKTWRWFSARPPPRCATRQSPEWLIVKICWAKANTESKKSTHTHTHSRQQQHNKKCVSVCMCVAANEFFCGSHTRTQAHLQHMYLY